MTKHVLRNQASISYVISDVTKHVLRNQASISLISYVISDVTKHGLRDQASISYVISDLTKHVLRNQASISYVIRPSFFAMRSQGLTTERRILYSKKPLTVPLSQNNCQSSALSSPIKEIFFSSYYQRQSRGRPKGKKVPKKRKKSPKEGKSEKNCCETTVLIFFFG